MNKSYITDLKIDECTCNMRNNAQVPKKFKT